MGKQHKFFPTFAVSLIQKPLNPPVLFQDNELDQLVLNNTDFAHVRCERLLHDFIIRFPDRGSYIKLKHYFEGKATFCLFLFCCVSVQRKSHPWPAAYSETNGRDTRRTRLSGRKFGKKHFGPYWGDQWHDARQQWVWCLCRWLGKPQSWVVFPFLHINSRWNLSRLVSKVFDRSSLWINARVCANYQLCETQHTDFVGLKIAALENLVSGRVSDSLHLCTKDESCFCVEVKDYFRGWEHQYVVFVLDEGSMSQLDVNANFGVADVESNFRLATNLGFPSGFVPFTLNEREDKVFVCNWSHKKFEGMGGDDVYRIGRTCDMALEIHLISNKGVGNDSDLVVFNDLSVEDIRLSIPFGSSSLVFYHGGKKLALLQNYFKGEKFRHVKVITDDKIISKLPQSKDEARQTRLKLIPVSVQFVCEDDRLTVFQLSRQFRYVEEVVAQSIIGGRRSVHYRVSEATVDIFGSSGNDQYCILFFKKGKVTIFDYFGHN